MENEKAWQTVLSIPAWLVQGVHDRGMDETIELSGEISDSDDLRVAIELSGGVDVLIDGHSRVVVNGENILIQTYK